MKDTERGERASQKRRELRERCLTKERGEKQYLRIKNL